MLPAISPKIYIYIFFKNPAMIYTQNDWIVYSIKMVRLVNL